VPVHNFVTQHTVAEQIVIVPATPVNLNYLWDSDCHSNTRPDSWALLSETNIVLVKTIAYKPSCYKYPDNPDIQIFLVRSGTKISNVQQTIPIPVQTILDNSLTFGTKRYSPEWFCWYREILTYQDNLLNNVVVGQTLIQTVITTAVPEIIARAKRVQIPADKKVLCRGWYLPHQTILT